MAFQFKDLFGEESVRDVGHLLFGEQGSFPFYLKKEEALPTYDTPFVKEFLPTTVSDPFSSSSLPAGITPISPSKVMPETNKDMFNPEDVRKMAGEVISPTSHATEFTAQRGKDKISVKGTAPSEVIEAPEGRGGMGMPSITGEYPFPEQDLEPGGYFSQGVPGQGPSFWQKLDEFVRSPQFRYTLAQAGQAIAPTSPGIQQMGEFGKQLVTSDIAKKYRAALEKGEDPDVVRGSELLTLQQKEGLRREAADKQKAKVTEEYMKSLGGQAEAITAGTAPYKERFAQEEYMTMMEIANKPEDWIKWGYDEMRNMKTGKTVKVSAPPRESSNAEETQARQWFKLAMSSAANDPEVQQYIGKGGLVVDANGNVNIQWTDPIRGKAAFESAKKRKLQAMAKGGLVPAAWSETLTEVSDLYTAPQELTSVPTAAETVAMAVGTEFILYGQLYRISIAKRDDPKGEYKKGDNVIEQVIR